jgi:uncharacterized RDD family membrane protein YckC
MADYAAIHREQEARTRRSLITPEGIDLSLKLADAGQRMSAFLLDFLIMLAVLIGASLILLLAGITGGMWAAQAAGIIWLIGFFLLRNCYFIIMEMGPRAATYGKRILGLRVVARNGGRLTADAVIARNLMREIEVYLPLSFLAVNANEGLADTAATIFGLAWACIFLFFPLFNRDRLRVGDLLAGTWVINTPKRGLSFDLVRAPGTARQTFTDEQLNVYGAFELQTLEQVLRVGNTESMATVADSIRVKIDSWEQVSDQEFLTSYYEALRARLERNLLFGRRRLDKHDRNQ